MMNDTTRKNPAARFITMIWDLFVSPTAFVVLAIIWCLDLAIGSIYAYKLDPQFWMKMDSVPFNYWMNNIAPKMWPDSLWVYILVVLTYLMVASLLLCTVNWFFRRRKKMRGMGEFLVHLGFLLVFAGFVLGSGWGARVQNIALFPGEDAPIEELGLRLKLNELEVKQDRMGRDLDTVSHVTITDVEGQNVLKEGTARLNNPVIHGSTVVYPNRWQKAPRDAAVTIKDHGRFVVTTGRNTPISEERGLEILGFLGPGKNWGRKVGPGVFLSVTREPGQSLFTQYLSLRGEGRTASFGDMEITLEGVQEGPQALFNIHRDPGIQFVLFGALILTLGTFWALFGYLRRPNQ